MIICGIKLTHDGAVSVINDGKLKICVEMEKISNNKRYSELDDLSRVVETLGLIGMTADDVDSFVVDGWVNRSDEETSLIQTRSNGRELTLKVAGYNDSLGARVVSLPRRFFAAGLPLAGKFYDYASYPHAAGHIYGAYCAAPFARTLQASYALIWDGGQYPELYFIDPINRTLENKGVLFELTGSIYGIMGSYFGPYARAREKLEEYQRNEITEGYFGGYTTSGKLMSYIALGNRKPELLAEMLGIYNREFEPFVAHERRFEHRFMRALKSHVQGRGYSDADILLTLHTFLEQMLLKGLQLKIANDPSRDKNIFLSGGSALNIKWNSAIRDSGMFRSTWVAPFPNDSGSSIGAACCEMISQTQFVSMNWDVYSGPQIRIGDVPEGWRGRSCEINELASILSTDSSPVVFLQGRAELGPRALGNRSIYASAAQPETKVFLNKIKNREYFRPIAPICLEEHANEIFCPGNKDPYMLFDHQVREGWKSRVPAICHVDGTARLQTVNTDENGPVYALLREYYRLTGIPLLCNTSANFEGSGFFPDAESAMRWGHVNRVFCQGTLFERVP